MVGSRFFGVGKQQFGPSYDVDLLGGEGGGSTNDGDGGSGSYRGPASLELSNSGIGSSLRRSRSRATCGDARTGELGRGTPGMDFGHSCKKKMGGSLINEGMISVTIRGGVPTVLLTLRSK